MRNKTRIELLESKILKLELANRVYVERKDPSDGGVYFGEPVQLSTIVEGLVNYLNLDLTLNPSDLILTKRKLEKTDA